MKKFFSTLIMICMLFSGGYNEGNSQVMKTPVRTEAVLNDSVSVRRYEPRSKLEYWDFLSNRERFYYDMATVTHYPLVHPNAYYKRPEINEQVCQLIGDYDKDLSDKMTIFYFLDYPEVLLRFTSPGLEENLKEIDNEISSLVDKVNQEKSKIRKYEMIYTWITTTVTYNESDKSIITSNETMYGAIVKKRASCSGISDAFKYICDKCNLDCLTVVGKCDECSGEFYSWYGIPSAFSCHKWNIVPIGNTWFLVDCSLGLVTNNSSTKSASDYFLIDYLDFDGRTPYYSGVPGYPD